MLTTIFRLVSSRLQFVTLFLLIIVVIDLGHVQSTTPRPSGFTRIARDLGRKCIVARANKLKTSGAGQACTKRQYELD
jgi:hypothetical protein